jgi:hypothetical protein
MISKKLEDKNEAPQASTRMFTNMLNGLIIDAKLERKKFVNNNFKRAWKQK